MISPFYRIHDFLPQETSCVPSALAVRKYLLRRGVLTDCRFGAYFKTPGKLVAHCWLELNGETIWGKTDDIKKFYPLGAR